MFWKYACKKFYIEENTHAKKQFNQLTLRQPHFVCPIFSEHLFLKTPLDGCFCYITSLPNKSFILCESKLNLIHNRWLFARYVLFVSCLLLFKPSLATSFSLICRFLLLKISNCNAVVSCGTRVNNRFC